MVSIIAPFYDVPALKKTGDLTYHSSLFVSERPKNGIIKVHGGTLLDYIFVIDHQSKGPQRTKFILQEYLEGLLNLMEELPPESKNSRVRGTSYIINEKTSQRIGFQVVETDFL
mgnify:FL=1